MNELQLKNYWKSEEDIAHIHGWDFSHIEGRFLEEQDKLSWSYKDVINKYRNSNDILLDIDTGGGEFLLSLNHPHDKTYATEGYPPNVELCKNTLSPLGVNFFEVNDYSKMPFENEQFDIIINRHGAYDIQELYRILKKDGIFITQQVGEDNDRELVELLLPNTPKQFSGLNLKEQKRLFLNQGFSILEENEEFKNIKFFDVGALVWFAKIIQWEFIDFSVDKCYNQLLKAHDILKVNGSIDGKIHRYLIVAQK